MHSCTLTHINAVSLDKDVFKKYSSQSVSGRRKKKTPSEKFDQPFDKPTEPLMFATNVKTNN